MSSESSPATSQLRPGPAWRAAERFGCDMELLAESLALSPAERLRLHTMALRRVELLEAAMKRAQGGSRSPA